MDEWYTKYMTTGKLLKKAKARKMKPYNGVKQVRQGDVELALAWAKGQVGIVQVSHAYSLKCHSTAYRHLALALRAYVQQQQV